MVVVVEDLLELEVWWVVEIDCYVYSFGIVQHLDTLLS